MKFQEQNSNFQAEPKTKSEEWGGDLKVMSFLPHGWVRLIVTKIPECPDSIRFSTVTMRTHRILKEEEQIILLTSIALGFFIKTQLERSLETYWELFLRNFLRKMHHMNWYYRPWQKVLLLFGAEISFLNQEKHHELKIDKSYFCIQPQMRVIFLVILFKHMWRISGTVAFLFELHVAAEPFFHSFYSCDASGSVDIVGWKYHTWQGNLFGLCHTIRWSESQVWGSLTSDLWHRGKGR